MLTLIMYNAAKRNICEARNNYVTYCQWRV
jgi:hypothetical protein